MSTFEVKVVRIDAIEPINGADAIELAKIADYRSVVRKGDYKAGDVAAYIPEASVVPEWLLKKMGLEGKLAGPNKNRVKAIKLRGCLSQGLLYPVITVPYPPEYEHPGIWGFEVETGNITVKLGSDVATWLGITKYEPPIPTHMAGEVMNLGTEHVLKFDVENLKKFPDVFTVGENVSVTEKLHGTFCQIGYVPGLKHPELFQNGDIFIASKGLGAQGLVFKNNENNKSNVYVKAYNALTETGNIVEVFLSQNKPMYILGEVFGKGVQDLDYGSTSPQFRIFDIYVGAPGQGEFLTPEKMQEVAKELNIPTVTVLYTGPYDRAKIDELSTGQTTLGGQHIREGVVVKPEVERRHDEIGRVFLKHINEAYLLRKGNATEFN